MSATLTAAMSHVQYIKALQRIDVLMSRQPAPDSADGMELMMLVGDVEAYEVEAYRLHLSTLDRARWSRSQS